MDEIGMNKDSQTFFGKVNTSGRTTFGLKAQGVIASVSEAIQRIFTKTNHKTRCNSKLVSESHVVKIPHQPLSKQFTELFCSAEWDDKRGIPLLCKALAFTLAEILIVMGIIGVVSALTIPNLNSSTADKEKVAKVKKIYQNLEEAQERAVATYGPMKTWFVSDTSKKVATNKYADRIMEFMKVSKDCKQSVSGCFQNKNYKDSDNTDHGGGPNVWPDDRKFNLADGASISLSIEPVGANACKRADDGTKFGESNRCGSLSVDIDGGLKGKNAYGIDLFQFVITTDGILPSGIENSNGGSSTNLVNWCFKKGNACTGWVIANDNMDYLKTDASGKCPNGKVLNWTTNTSCK